MKEPKSKPALVWYPVANLIHRALLEALIEEFEGHLDFWLPFADELAAEERENADIFSDTAYIERIQIYLRQDGVTFSWTNERTGGDKYSFDMEGEYFHSPEEWGTSPKLESSYKDWFEDVDSIYEKGIILQMNSIPQGLFEHDMDLKKVEWDWVRPWAD